MSAVDLNTLKLFLNIPLAVTKDDTELQRTLDAAEQTIARKVGPLEPTPVNRTVTALAGGRILLPIKNVLSVLSVTRSGTAAAVTAVVDSVGVVTLPGTIAAGSYVVSVLAGFYELPGDLEQAVLELTRHLWTSQRGPAARRGADAAPLAGYLLPLRVQELLEPYELPGFA